MRWSPTARTTPRVTTSAPSWPFIRQDFDAALDDLDKALERQPNHVAALSGKALTLFQLDRPGEGQAMLRRAVRLNPWIPERGLLEDEETF
jgi:tetratricopeptide (TPR) repeat protein